VFARGVDGSRHEIHVSRDAACIRKIHFVTQLPSHLPDEVFGLINNWILDKITDTSVIQRLRKVVPAVNEATWSSLPNLAPGQALCSFTHLTHPIMAAMDPSPCQVRMVD
jgi:uncharacterized protein